MTGPWPDGWVIATLRDADLPVTDFTRKALYAWNTSTPIPVYTNNPLGMPAVPGKSADLLHTGFAMFPSMREFRAAFSVFIASPDGHRLRDALSLDEKYSKVWRAVNSLKWPSTRTETDWPSDLLDLASQSYRDRMASVPSPADRKTSGVVGPEQQYSTGTPSRAIRSTGAPQAIQQATDFIRSIPGRMS
jgi:hypothetical protein